jgi:hypothetical protein
MSDAYYLTEAEFAERFRISRRTLQRWRETGQGPVFIRLGARRLAYPLADALRWAAEHTYGSRVRNGLHTQDPLLRRTVARAEARNSRYL